MPNRKIPFVIGEKYHIFNRGTDKRNIFMDLHDLNRFFLCMNLFNHSTPIKSVWNLKGKPPKNKDPLVSFICYCLNPNHFHFLLEQLKEGGVSEFMKRMGAGYTCFFNEKYKRNGALFQGSFKSVHIETNTQLLHTSAYINLNNQIEDIPFELSKSSWEEYTNTSIKSFCKKEIILNQFNNIKDYKLFALSSLKDIRRRKSKDFKQIEGFHPLN